MHSWDSPLPAFQTERFLTGVLSNALKGLSPGAHFQTIPPSATYRHIVPQGKKPGTSPNPSSGRTWQTRHEPDPPAKPDLASPARARIPRQAGPGKPDTRPNLSPSRIKHA